MKCELCDEEIGNYHQCKQSVVARRTYFTNNLCQVLWHEYTSDDSFQSGQEVGTPEILFSFLTFIATLDTIIQIIECNDVFIVYYRRPE